MLGKMMKKKMKMKMKMMKMKSTEFEDDDGDIADYVHEMEFDEEVLSEIRNNLMSPTDIDPILISNLQGVRIRATGFPSTSWY